MSAIVGIAICRPSEAQVLLHDFDDGTTGDWELINDLAAGQTYGPTQYEVKDGQLIIGSNGPAPFIDDDLNSFFQMTWRPSVDSTQYTNGYLQATVRPPMRRAQSGILLRAGDDPNEVDYEFWHNPDLGTFWFGRWDKPRNNYDLLKWTRAGVAPYEEGGAWIMKAGVVDNEISLKYWRPGEPEPSSPQLSVRDRSIAPFDLDASQIGLAMQGIQGTRAIRGAFDDVYFTAVPHIDNGDFDFDGNLDVKDIGLLVAAVNANSTDPTYDKNGDGAVTQGDLTTWVHEIKQTYFGDANLDGEFNSGDLVDVFGANQYEDGIPMNSGWSEGDWNGDQEFDSGDLVLAFSDAGFEAGPRPAAVPEPSGWILAITGMTTVLLNGRGKSIVSSSMA